MRTLLSPSIISTGSISKGIWQYYEKAHTSVIKQIIAFGLLRAVTSINTFFVSIDIFDLSEFIIGGTEHTLSSQSKING